MRCQIAQRKYLRQCGPGLKDNWCRHFAILKVYRNNYVSVLRNVHNYSKQGGNIHLEVQYAKPIRMIRMSKSEMRMLKSAYDIKKGELHTL